MLGSIRQFLRTGIVVVLVVLTVLTATIGVQKIAYGYLMPAAALSKLKDSTSIEDIANNTGGAGVAAGVFTWALAYKMESVASDMHEELLALDPALHYYGVLMLGAHAPTMVVDEDQQGAAGTASPIPVLVIHHMSGGEFFYNPLTVEPFTDDVLDFVKKNLKYESNYSAPAEPVYKALTHSVLRQKNPTNAWSSYIELRSRRLGVDTETIEMPIEF